MRLWTMLVGAVLVGMASHAATVLNIDARQAPTPIETDYFYFGASIAPNGSTIGINNRYLALNGKPWLPVMGEFHYTRVPQQNWEEELLKMRNVGVSIVSTYIFWNHHENIQGHFVWTNNRDLRRFVTLCGRLGFKVVVRPGPWVHSEARFGGIPDWVVRAMPTRSNDTAYLRYVARYWQGVSQQLKGLLWKNGGPVIGMQLENEYFRTGPGEGRDHIAALKRIALQSGLDVPLYTVTGWDNTVFPEREVVPLQGGYADQPWGLTTEKFPPAETYAFRFGTRVRGDLAADKTTTGDAEADIAHTPFLGAEFGGGVPTMYRRRPIMTADDVAAMLPVQLGSGVNLYGYYMFHGGQNSPDHDSLEETTSIGAYNDLPMIDYDFQAPLGAYGQQHGSLAKIRPIHYFLQAFGAELAPMTVHKPELLPKDSADLATPRFAVRSLGDRGFLFFSNYVRQYPMAVQKDVQFSVALPGRTITFPQRPIDIPSGAYFIWPINMKLPGADLVYATAEPVTHFDSGNVPTFVFRAQDGIPTELALEGSDIRDVTARSGSVIRDSGTGRFVVSNIHPGTEAEIILTTVKGAVRLLILDTANIDRMSLITIGSRTHLALSPSPLYSNNNDIVMHSIGEPRFTIAFFPGLSHPPAGNFPISPAGNDGLFQVFHAQAPARTVALSVSKLREAQPVPPLAMTGPSNTAVEPTPETFGRSAAWTIGVPANALKGIDDLFLQIRARGDVGRLFSGTTMIDDQFFNGTVWEIGLKNYAKEIREPLTLTILPMRRDAAIYLDAGVGAMVEGEQTSELVEVKAVPQYRLQLRVEGTRGHRKGTR